MTQMNKKIGLSGIQIFLLNLLIGAAQADDDVPILDEVEVTVPPQAERAESVTFLGQEQFDDSRFTILNDALFFGIPGVATSRQTNVGFFGPSGGFLIRGFGRQQVSVYVDGIPSQVTNHFHPISDQYTPDMIDRVEVVRSPTGLSDGPNALGSVHVFTPKVPREGMTGFFEMNGGSLDTKFGSGRVGYGWESGGFWVGATAIRTDGVRGGGLSQNTGNFKFAQDLGENWLVEMRLARTEDDVDDRVPEGVPPSDGVFSFNSTSAVMTLDRTTQHSSSTGSFFVNSAIFERNGLETNEENEFGTRLKQSWSNLYPGNKLSLGFDATRFTISQPDFIDVFFWSPYAEVSQELEVLEGQTTVITAGLRFTDSSDFDSDLSPRVSVVHHWDQTTAIRLNIAKGFQIPRAQQLGGGGNQLPNAGLQPGEFYSEELGINKTFELLGRRGMLDVVGFLQQGSNALREVIVTAAPLTTQIQNTGSFDHKGVEAALDYQLFPELSLSLGLTLLDLEAVTDRAPMPEEIFDFKLDYRKGPFRAVWQTRHASDIFIRREDDPTTAPVERTVRLDDYTVSNLMLGVALRNPRVMFSFNVENITDERFATFAGVTPNNAIRPFTQPDRTFFAKVRLEFDK